MTVSNVVFLESERLIRVHSACVHISTKCVHVPYVCKCE